MEALYVLNDVTTLVLFNFMGVLRLQVQSHNHLVPPTFCPQSSWLALCFPWQSLP